MTIEFMSHASPKLLAKAQSMGVIVRGVRPVPNPGGMSYYHHVFVKFRVFELLEYKRLLYFDSDCIFLKAMDELFALPPAPLYAPRAWWEKKFFTSMLMVIDPAACQPNDKNMWDRVGKKDNWFDMDILNDMYGSYISLLSPYLSTLVGHWADLEAPTPFPDALDSLLAKISHVHFTFGRKPWDFPASRVLALSQLRSMKPKGTVCG